MKDESVINDPMIVCMDLFKRCAQDEQ